MNNLNYLQFIVNQGLSSAISCVACDEASHLWFGGLFEKLIPDTPRYAHIYWLASIIS